jgi:hypothetical protein
MDKGGFARPAGPQQLQTFVEVRAAKDRGPHPGPQQLDQLGIPVDHLLQDLLGLRAVHARVIGIGEGPGAEVVGSQRDKRGGLQV